MRILILGANGMLGHVLFNYFSKVCNFKTFGTVRLRRQLASFTNDVQNNIHLISIQKDSEIIKIINKLIPDLIINCLGLVKQKFLPNDFIMSIQMNALLPHRLAKITQNYSVRLINFSSDCVFSGNKGMYTEIDKPDPSDLYGKTKLIGEVYYGNVLTIRTSFLGHQIDAKYSLLEWLLSQKVKCKGFVNAIYSGLPTIELAMILKDHIIFNNDLFGLYQISSDPINKYELLSLINDIYDLKLDIVKEDKFILDRSLNSQKFRDATGYEPPNWRNLIKKMYKYRGLSNV